MNPFSTRYTSPGNCRFLTLINFLEVEQNFAAAGYRGQIVGPHGCGKTTLAVALAKKLDCKFSEIRLVTVRRKERVQPLQLKRLTTTSEFEIRSSGLERKTLFVVDGTELLSPLNRSLLMRASRFAGLLLTTHRGISGMKAIATLKPALQQFHSIVADLQINSAHRVARRDIESCYFRSNGNYRAGLQLLYDEHALNVRNTRSTNPAATIAAAE